MHEPFPAIARAGVESSETVCPPDYGHFTPRGHETLAADLVDQLVARGLVP